MYLVIYLLIQLLHFCQVNYLAIRGHLECNKCIMNCINTFESEKKVF